MVRAYFLLMVILSLVAPATAADVTLPDTIRILPQQRLRIPVAGKLPRLGQLDATIRFTPGVARIANVQGDKAYALTCASFGVTRQQIDRSVATIDVSCGSGGAGVHDTLFAIVLEGVYSADTEGTLEIIALELDGSPLPVNSNACVVLKDDTQQGNHITPVSITGNYPNPFNTTTRVSYSVSSDQAVTINVRTIQGKLVKSFADVQARAGENEFEMAFMESDIGSGRYIVELITREATVYHGMAVMR